MKVSEIERIRDGGVRSVSPADFGKLVAFALECAKEIESPSLEEMGVQKIDGNFAPEEPTE